MTWITMIGEGTEEITHRSGVDVRFDTTGQRIHWLRRDTAKVKQKDLSVVLGIAQSYLSDMEADKREPSAEVTRRLAEALNTTTDYLLLRTDDPSPPKDAEPTTFSAEAKEAADMIDDMYPDLRVQALRAVRGIHSHYLEHAWRDQAIKELLVLIEATKGPEYRQDVERRLGLRPGFSNNGESFRRDHGGN